MFSRSLYLIGRNTRSLSLNTRSFHNLAQIESRLTGNLGKGLTFMAAPLILPASNGIFAKQQLIPSSCTSLRAYSSSPVHFALPRFRITPTSTATRPKPLIDEDSELANLSPPIQAHLRNVYSSLATTFLIAGGASTLGMLTGFFISPGISLLGGIGLILGIGFTPPENQRLRLGMLYSFALLEGFSLVPLLMSVASVTPTAIPAALLGTGTIFLGFTGLSLISKSRSMLTLGGPLFGTLLGIFGLQIAGFFFPSLAAISHSVSLYGGLALFSAYISYDTQRIIENARYGNTDVVGDSLSMFLNVWNIFVRLLYIFRGNND